MHIIPIMLAVLMFQAPNSDATFSIMIKIEDVSGEALKDELVIVQDLNDREHEILRILSDKNGYVPPLKLPSGLYRIIAVAPYGPWETNVREFLVRQQPTEVVVTVQPKGTHGNGDIVTLGIPRAELRVIGKDEQPVSGAKILVRDRIATLHLERWYKTDQYGIAVIELVGDPTFVVVVSGDNLYTTKLATTERNPVIHIK